MPPKKNKRETLLVRSVLVTREIDDALNEDARNRGWGKSKLMRSIMISWLSYYKVTKRAIKPPAIDTEKMGEDK